MTPDEVVAAVAYAASATGRILVEATLISAPLGALVYYLPWLTGFFGTRWP